MDSDHQHDDGDHHRKDDVNTITGELGNVDEWTGIANLRLDDPVDEDESPGDGFCKFMLDALFKNHLEICEETEFYRYGTDDDQTIADFMEMLSQNHMVDALGKHAPQNTKPVLDPAYAKTAYALRAAYRAWYGYGDAGTGYEPVDYFLRRSFDKFMGFESESETESESDMPKLPSIVQGMMARLPKSFIEDQKKEWGLDWPEDEDEDEDEDESTQRVHEISIFVGAEVIEVPLKEILSCFWTKRLDTACDACGEPFGREPPIRTITLYQSKSAISNMCIRIFNRHLCCLVATEAAFVPVSHVWHSAVRIANESQNTSDEIKDEAASVLMDTLVTLFEGAERAYEPDTEFWHDYFSVPQWESETRDSLLLCLPSIYNQAAEILVHVPDLRASYVKSLMLGVDNMALQVRGSAVSHELSLGHAILAFPSLLALRRSQWMQRMWVTLEYSRSKRACLMDQSNYIIRDLEDENPTSRDTFTTLLQGARLHTRELYRHTDKLPPSLRSLHHDLMNMPHRNTGQEQQSLGEAMEVVGRKQCHFVRDRFIAIHLLLNRDILPTDQILIPQQLTEACAVVWLHALSQNDYSPLLLQPRECVPTSNPGSHVPSYLVGHQSPENAEWKLGVEYAPPLRPLIIEGSRVQMEADYMGEMEHIHCLTFEESGDVAGLDWAIGLLDSIATREGVTLSAQNLFEGLNRVFLFNMTKFGVKATFTFSAIQERDNDFGTKLQEQLDHYRSALDGVQGDGSRRTATEEIWKLISFDDDMMEPLVEEKVNFRYTRWDVAKMIAQRRRLRGCEQGEPICEVRCPKCRVVTLFRFDLRDNSRIGDRVYHIPGLSYDSTEKNGVGLIINAHGRITGRMCFGVPLCECRVTEKVEIH